MSVPSPLRSVWDFRICWHWGGLFDSDVVSEGAIELIRFQFYKKYAILGTSLLQAVVGLEFVHLGLKQEINDSPWEHRSAEQTP